MIRFHNVSKIYPPQQEALRAVSLQVKEGEFVFLAGASGAGKSTMLKLLYGSEQATGGEVVVAGRNMPKLPPGALSDLRRDLGIVFQDYKLLPRRSVIDNVAYGLEVRGVRSGDRRKAAVKLLEAINLADRADSFPLTLSGGEQQRVALARALIHKPRLLLADEPTGNLDPEMSRIVFELLLEANMAGVTVLVATHNLGVIEELNRRTLVLDKGKLLGDFERPRSIE